MDGQHFDAITRMFGRGLSRRQFAGAIGAALAGVLTTSGLASAAGCRRAKAMCRKNENCCSGFCAEPDETGRMRCACPAGTEECKGNCVDPASAYLSDPNNCGGCGIKCKRTRCGVAACIDGVCGVGPDPKTVGRSCDDGLLCTTNDVCQADGTCAGTPVNCSVTEPKCQSATCSPATGQCETTNFAAGTSCADDDRCDGEEACDGNGVCSAGTPVSCAHLDSACAAGVCDPASGKCSSVPVADLTPCNVFGIPNGYCCSGICSQCCNDASVCTSLFAETENFITACQDPVQYGELNCVGECDPSIIPANNPICTNPAVLGGVNQQCFVGGGQFVTCLNCRLPVGSQCSADTQCCGFCVNGTCQEGSAGSPCADSTDCAADLYCDPQGVCAVRLAIGSACASTEVCAPGTSCGTIVGSNVDTFCCLPIDAACSEDGDCCQNGGVQERCVLGFCKTRGDAGAACGKDFDCAGVLTCINGTCGPRVGLGGACDSDGDCVFDQTSNTKPVCSNGTCRLPNGATTASAADCAFGAAVQCDYGTVCGNCCTRDTLGFDPVFCGDDQSEKICCNNQCIYRDDTNHCGGCDVDCTCGGTDPYRYCTTQYDSEAPSWAWPAVCSGTYNAFSGHCAQATLITPNQTFYDYCSTNCPTPEPCDCTQPITSLFCYAGCVGQSDNLSLSTCAPDGETCLGGRDETCCGENSTCEVHSNCSPGVTFCLSNDYICIGNT